MGRLRRAAAAALILGAIGAAAVLLAGGVLTAQNVHAILPPFLDTGYLVAVAPQLAGLALAFARKVHDIVTAPTLQSLVGLTSPLLAFVAADRLFHVYIALYHKYVAKQAPEDKYRFVPLPSAGYASSPARADDFVGTDQFPRVVVQLPMFNERECCQAIIDAACELDWPRDKLFVQVLDDSTCDVTRARIADRVADWSEQGMNIELRWRSNRSGYKAGALAEGLKALDGAWEFAAIFDADFSPEPHFLLQTVPYLHHNPELAFVQARWTYANERESLLTRTQVLSLNYHIKCEQFSRHAANLFWNFNGTAGVWRVRAIEEVGGWNNRTTVEDMDLSLRAWLHGWRFCFLNDVTCLNEVPSNYEAYRRQQHRWSCGPMQLWRKATAAVWASRIPFTQKVYLNVFFFGSRLFATHIVSFFFFCVLIPLSVLTPTVTVPFWALIYVPVLITLTTAAFSKDGLVLAVVYVLYENAMSIVKLSAMLSGLLELSDAHEWVVTTKLGSWMQKAKKHSKLASKVSDKVGDTIIAVKAAVPKTQRRIYKRELCMAAFLLGVAVYGILVTDRAAYCVFLVLQGLTFAAFGLGMVDTGYSCTG